MGLEDSFEKDFSKLKRNVEKIVGENSDGVFPLEKDEPVSGYVSKVKKDYLRDDKPDYVSGGW